MRQNAIQSDGILACCHFSTVQMYFLPSNGGEIPGAESQAAFYVYERTVRKHYDFLDVPNRVCARLARQPGELGVGVGCGVGEGAGVIGRVFPVIS